MSILIKGLEMPEDGALLCLRIYPSGVVRTCFSPPQPPGSKIATAIPIFYHGDLIERDALKEDMDDKRDCETWIGIEECLKCADAAPVVIPAERSEE